MSSVKLRQKIGAGASVAALTLAASVVVAAPASATQYLVGQYCGPLAGEYVAFSDSGLGQAGTYHSTGPLCGNYWVNTHYVVTTTGATYFVGWQSNPTDIRQTPGYFVDYAYHRTDQSATIITH